MLDARRGLADRIQSNRVQVGIAGERKVFTTDCATELRSLDQRAPRRRRATASEWKDRQTSRHSLDWRGHDGEEKASAVGHQAWEYVADFTQIRSRPREDLDVSALLRHLHQASSDGRSEDDLAGSRPHGAVRLRRIGDRDRRAPLKENLLQLSIREEPDPHPVWREKWRRRAIRVGYWPRPKRSEIA